MDLYWLVRLVRIRARNISIHKRDPLQHPVLEICDCCEHFILQHLYSKWKSLFFPKPIHDCDNYPWLFPLAHLHNQHQSFTVAAQRNITRQKTKEREFTCLHNVPRHLCIQLFLHTRHHKDFYECTTLRRYRACFSSVWSTKGCQNG